MSSETLWWGLFLAASTVLIVLPLLPAFLEWRSPTDVDPLPIVREHDGDCRRFALALRALVEPYFSALADAANRGINREVTLAGGGRLVLLGAQEKHRMPEWWLRESILAAATDFSLPYGTCAASGIYAARDLSTAPGAVIRSAFAEGDIRLEKEVEVLRWIHACRTLAAADLCRLNGRASADGSIELGRNVLFQRLNAPIVRTGNDSAPRQSREEALRILDPGGQPLDRAGRFSLLEGDLEVPAGHAVIINIVVLGCLSVGADSEIRGHVKAGRHLEIGPRAAVTGAVVCAGDIHVGPDATIGGPLVAEGRIHLSEGSRVGSLLAQTTVCARHITLARNVSIHGTLWAQERGETEGSAP